MNNYSNLTNISPLDGRYLNKTQSLRPICSEYGLIYFRVIVEIRWLIALSEAPTINEVPALNNTERDDLEQIIKNFSEADAQAVKDIEATTNHDVKAVEYFLQQKLQHHETLSQLIPFIHFGCTSEDINNSAYAAMLQAAREQVLLPSCNNIISKLNTLANETAAMPMLSRTHGQSASPTTMGKEIRNVIHRLQRTLAQLESVEITAKFNGAVGNYNAHLAAYPDIDWPMLSKTMIESLGLTWLSHSTQIEPHDQLAAFMHAHMRFNTILIDFCRDTWGYISLGYFGQKKVEGEVGSSTMPHKVNPIDFENAEGNFGLANALADHLANKLPISRWQRDLTDSTVLRNLGSVFGYSLIAMQSLEKGIGKLQPQAQRMQNELEQHWEVLAEPIQTVMRRFGITDAYEQLKALTRGQAITREALHELINNLDIPATDKQRLLTMTPSSYIGLAQLLARQ